MNRTRTHVYAQTEAHPNPEVNKWCKNPNRIEPYPVENRTETEPKCHGSYSVRRFFHIFWISYRWQTARRV